LQYEAALYAPAVAVRLPAACRRAGVPLVTTFHSLDGPKAWGHSRRLALLPLLLGSDAVVVCAGRPFRALSRVPALAGKTHLIPVGSTVPAAARRGTAAAAEARGVPLRMVYFGFVWAGRGLDAAVRALAAAHAASPTGATLTLIGEVRDPAHAAELTSLARTLGVEGRVAFTGNLSAPEVSRRLADADVALLPYPTGVSTGRTTLMAALEHVLPVVTTYAPSGGLDARFRDGENMLLSPAGDADAFARETARAATDVGLRARLSAGASRLAREFSWERIAEEIARVYYGVGRGR
jgi:glycosyltransferase involved in cell wall biosynthesis